MIPGFQARLSRLVAGVALLWAALATPAGAQNADNAWKDPARFADELFRLTNAARVANGLPEYRRDVRLDKAAALFSHYMGEAGFFAHVGPDGVEVPDREVAQGYRHVNWGENIAWGYRTPQDTFEGWMTSPGHRANILNPSFKDIGIGVAWWNGTPYMTQDFGTLPASELPGPAAAPTRPGSEPPAPTRPAPSPAATRPASKPAPSAARKPAHPAAPRTGSATGP